VLKHRGDVFPDNIEPDVAHRHTIEGHGSDARHVKAQEHLD
jgi:hypothetical protein